MDKELQELQYKVYKLTGWANESGENPYTTLTSDYLLEKLPYSMPAATKIDLPYFLYVSGSPDHDWLAYYGREGEMGTWKDVLVYSDTPLKALLKLCIALHEAGELK